MDRCKCPLAACVFVCQHVCLSICLSVCLSVCMYVGLFVFMSIYLSIYTFWLACLFTCASLCMCNYICLYMTIFFLPLSRSLFCSVILTSHVITGECGELAHSKNIPLKKPAVGSEEAEYDLEGILAHHITPAIMQRWDSSTSIVLMSSFCAVLFSALSTLL